MKYLIISDSHGVGVFMNEVFARVGNHVEAIFHLGDMMCSEKDLERISGCKVYGVKGNCDYGSSLPESQILNIEGHRIGLIHGHRQHVKMGTYEITQWGEENGVEVVMYGHTHVPMIRQEGRITLVNPGSITCPRREGSKPSFILMDIDRDGIHYSINEN